MAGVTAPTYQQTTTSTNVRNVEEAMTRLTERHEVQATNTLNQTLPCHKEAS